MTHQQVLMNGAEVDSMAGSVSIWNEAIDAAIEKVEAKEELWGEGCGYSPTKQKAATEIKYALETLKKQNDKVSLRGSQEGVTLCMHRNEQNCPVSSVGSMFWLAWFFC